MNLAVLMFGTLSVLQIVYGELLSLDLLNTLHLYFRAIDFFFLVLGFSIAESSMNLRNHVKLLLYVWLNVCFFSLCFLVYKAFVFQPSIETVLWELPALLLGIHNYFLDFYEVRWFGFLWPLFVTLQLYIVALVAKGSVRPKHLKFVSVTLILIGIFWDKFLLKVTGSAGFPSWSFSSAMPHLVSLGIGMLFSSLKQQSKSLHVAALDHIRAKWAGLATALVFGAGFSSYILNDLYLIGQFDFHISKFLLYFGLLFVISIIFWLLFSAPLSNQMFAAKQNHERLPDTDSNRPMMELRGWAVSIVGLNHFLLMFDWKNGSPLYRTTVVDFFFISSGLFVGYSLSKRYNALPDLSTGLNYIKERYIRFILPLVVFGGAISFVARTLNDKPIELWIKQIFYLASLQMNFRLPTDHSAMPWELGYTWTIVVEFHFYIIAALLFFIFKSNWARITSIAISVLVTALIRNHIVSTFQYPVTTELDLWTISQVPFFAAGLALCLLINAKQDSFNDHFEYLKKLAIFCLFTLGSFSFQFTSVSNFPYDSATTRTIIWIAVLLLSLSLRQDRNISGQMGLLFEWIGKHAYTIYGSHLLSLLIVRRLVSYALPNLELLWAFLIHLVFAYAVFSRFEKVASYFNRVSKADRLLTVLLTRKQT